MPIKVKGLRNRCCPTEEDLRETWAFKRKCGMTALCEFLKKTFQGCERFDGHILAEYLELGGCPNCESFDGKTRHEFIEYVYSGLYDKEREQADHRWKKFYDKHYEELKQWSDHIDQEFEKNCISMTEEQALRLADELENGTFEGHIQYGCMSKSEFIHYLRTKIK